MSIPHSNLFLIIELLLPNMIESYYQVYSKLFNKDLHNLYIIGHETVTEELHCSRQTVLTTAAVAKCDNG